VSEAEAQAISTWSPSHDSLLLDEHNRVSVNFHPLPGGRFALWARILASVSEIPRINHRMHNKLFVADNAIAITGGRNIGDQYFTRDPTSNFIDLDVVAAGPIVPQLSASFDAFWNSRYAYPIAAVAAPVDPEGTPSASPENGFSAAMSGSGNTACPLAASIRNHAYDRIISPTAAVKKYTPVRLAAS